MLSFLGRYRGLLLGGLLSLLALGYLTSGSSGVLGRSVGLLGAPVQTVVHGVAEGLGGLVDRYVWLVGARQEAARLRQEVGELKRELLAVEEVILENRRLKNLLDFRETTDLRLLPARVVGRSASVWFQTVVLDKGSEAGVEVDASVMTPSGLVGRITEVGRGASRALLVTDANSAVDALVQRTRSQVVVEGRLGPRLRILYLARGEDVVPGDRVVTSGLAGVFPKGLLIGEIASVDLPPGGVFQRAELAPGADFSRLEEVFVALRRADPQL